MIHILFIDNLPDSFADENAIGDVRKFADEIEFLEAWPEYSEIITPPKKPEFNLEHKKRVAVREIETVANQYQAKIIGTDDVGRAERFKLNLQAAKAIQAGTASPAQIASLQMQLDANKQTGHPIIQSMTLADFAAWIVDFEQLSFKATGLIEKVLTLGRAQIMNAESSAEISAIKLQLRELAAAEFAKLINGSGN